MLFVESLLALFMGTGALSDGDFPLLFCLLRCFLLNKIFLHGIRKSIGRMNTFSHINSPSAG